MSEVEPSLARRPDDLGVFGGGGEATDKGAQRKASPVHHLFTGMRADVLDESPGEVELEQDRHGRDPTGNPAGGPAHAGLKRRLGCSELGEGSEEVPTDAKPMNLG